MVEKSHFYGKSEPYVCITISYFRKFVKGRKGGGRKAAPVPLAGKRAAAMRSARPRPSDPALPFLFHHLIEPGERKADDIVIRAFYMRNKERPLALDAVRAGFIHRFTGGDVAIDLRS